MTTASRTLGARAQAATKRPKDKRETGSNAMGRIEARRIGNSTGFVIPREIVLRQDIKPGQGFHIAEIPGGVRITSYDPAFAQAMDSLDGLMDEYRDTLATLAK